MTHNRVRCGACQHSYFPRELRDGYCGSCWSGPATPEDNEPARPAPDPPAEPRRIPVAPETVFAVARARLRAQSGVPMAKWKTAQQQQARQLQRDRHALAQEVARRLRGPS